MRHFVFVTVVALLAVFIAGVPAEAVTPEPSPLKTCVPLTDICIGGNVYHWPDASYDPPIIAFCHYGAPWSNRKNVYEGETSKKYCGVDTDQIYIRAGEELWCRVPAPAPYWTKVFDSTGRHKINDLWSKSCTLRVD